MSASVRNFVSVQKVSCRNCFPLRYNLHFMMKKQNYID